MTNDIAEQAAAAAAEGWAVFPVLITAEGHKQPLVKWKDGASSDAATVRAMFARCPHANAFGVKTGQQPDGGFVVLVDLDVRDGAGGKAWYQANEERLGRTRAHGTRSGGVHLLHRVPAGVEIRNSASRLAPGVDIRGAGGYAVWPGTPGYEVKRPDPIAPLPDWLLAELLALKAKAVERSKAPLAAGEVPSLEAAEMVGDGSSYGLAALRSACVAIVGAEDGTKHETLNREAFSVGGLVASGDIREAVAVAALEEAVDAISGHCRDVGAARATLRTAYGEGKARPREGAGERAMRRAAKDFEGVEAPVLSDAETALRAVTGIGADGLTSIERMFQDWRWVESIERFGSVVTGEMLTRTQFNVRHSRVGKPHVASDCAAAQFLEDARRCKSVKGPTYWPGKAAEVVEPLLGGVCLNAWKPGALVPAAGDVAPWMDHVRMLVPDPGERRHALNFMRWLVQHPGEKINHAFVMGGRQGIGKDLMWQPVFLGLGMHNIRAIGVTDLLAAQTDYLLNAQVLVVTEMHSATRVALGDQLKTIIAAPPMTLRINTKMVPQYDVPNRVCVVMFTNHRDALSIEDGDRRNFIVWCECEARDDAYYTGLCAWYADGGAAAVVEYLRTSAIEGAFSATGRAPMTAAKAEMARDSRGELRAAVEDAVEAGDWPDIVNPEDLAARLNAGNGHNGRRLSGRGIAVVLKNLGAKPLNDGKMVRLLAPTTAGTARARLFALRDSVAYEAMPPAALARAFADGWAKKAAEELAANKNGPDLSLLQGGVTDAEGVS